MSSVTSTAHMERPERSRNAKAQARHRAKRKAYIEQLEQTVTKLQSALGLTQEEMTVLPPPLLRIRELEQENARLVKENDDFRRLLAESGGRTLPVDSIPRRNSLTSYQDARAHDRDIRRKKLCGDTMDGTYLSPGDTPPQGPDPIRPPPLTIPQPMSHQYSYPQQQHSNTQQFMQGPPSMFNMHATTPTFQMPNTPSGSSATSSPPFSPATLQEPITSPVNHRAPSLSSSSQSLSNYATRSHHYGHIKVEDDGYGSSHHTTQNGHYTLPPPVDLYSHHTDGMDNQWHSYSSERGHLHR